MTRGDVELARDGAVATVTMRRPERRNAMDPSLMRELAKAIADAEMDHAIRVVILAGEGPAFCAGADLDWMRADWHLPQAENLAEAQALTAGLEALDTCSKAVVARVHGAAIGGGAGLVACADVAVAARSARFGFAEARLGLIPAMISPYVLRKIGPGHARALFTTAKTFDAGEAFRFGLVHRVVAEDFLDTAIAEEVEAFLKCGPEAIAAAKRLVRDATASFRLDDLPERISAARAGDEGREGVAAFLEKRPPGWSASTDS